MASHPRHPGHSEPTVYQTSPGPRVLDALTVRLRVETNDPDTDDGRCYLVELEDPAGGRRMRLTQACARQVAADLHQQLNNAHRMQQAPA